MTSVSAVEIVGRACRLPGAGNVDALWDLLRAGRCTVTAIPEDRWSHAAFLHPRPGEPGKSYTFAAGVIGDLWSFDPAPFGLSRREAEQMDPQQRLLLEVVSEAIADCGWRPGDLAGREVGVWVGASSTDSIIRRAFDISAGDAYTMTGNTLSLIANRVSHVFDLRGPSLVVDTACSSSLVAIAEAMRALDGGRVDTAIVAGVSVLLSPFGFVGFSAASMLSPEGLCRSFDARGQGYVRAEGCVALVLRRQDSSTPSPWRRYARILAADVNSDGRTVGVALPSSAAQAALLERVYKASGIHPDALAFVEAHGTGTRAGDPAEARAIGEVLGRRRREPLSIGSIKSNIGHLEAASGLAGVLKALLALEHRLLPASLHCEEPNPDVPFAALNIRVAQEALSLEPRPVTLHAGVSSFGFGGTNAHVVLAEADTATAPPAHARDPASSGGPGMVLISAADAAALACLSADVGALLAEVEPARQSEIIAALVHCREPMAERVVALGPAPVLADALARFARHEAGDHTVAGRAVAREARTCFVYSGNGAQWAGMGRLALSANAGFRAAFMACDAVWRRHAGWSLLEALEAPDLDRQLASTTIAQPLLTALQIALTDALADAGLVPDAVLGHSVGEIAAAYAAGAFDRDKALTVVRARCASQEPTRGSGAMAAIQLDPDSAAELIGQAGASGIAIAALNSPRAVTIAGPTAAIEQVLAFAQRQAVTAARLGLDYPFHSPLMTPARAPLAAALAGLTPQDARRPMISTVSGGPISGRELTGGYWWRNVREPVRFADAVVAAVDLDCRVFVEIGPRPVLQTYLRETLGGRSAECAVVASLGRSDAADCDPVAMTLARALVRGSRVDADKVFGLRPERHVSLPQYPWQRTELRVRPTSEAEGRGLQHWPDPAGRHALLGERSDPSTPCWIGHIDTLSCPPLADHRVRGRVLVPAAALVELGLAAGRRWLGCDAVELADLDIASPLVLAAEHPVELHVQVAPATGHVEISSRARLTGEEWQVHAHGRLSRPDTSTAATVANTRGAELIVVEQGHDVLYAAARRRGLDYGPAFRRAARVLPTAAGLEVEIRPAAGGAADWNGAIELDPAALDAALHALLAAGDDAAYATLVPVRFERVRLYAAGRTVALARIAVRRATPHTLLADIDLLDEQSSPVATVSGVRLRALPEEHDDIADHAFAYVCESVAPVGEPIALPDLERILDRARPLAPPGSDASPRLLLEAAARRVAFDFMQELAGGNRIIGREALRCAAGADGARLAYVHDLMAVATRAGLAEHRDEGWECAAGTALPPFADIVSTVLADHPDWLAETVLITRARQLALLSASGAAPASAAAAYSQASLESALRHSPRIRRHIDAAAAILEDALRGRPAAWPTRILELGATAGGLTRRLAPLVARGGSLVAVAGTSAEAARLDAELPEMPNVRIIAEPDLASFDDPAGFDAVVSAAGLWSLSDPASALAQAHQRLDPAGVAVLTSEPPDSVQTVVMGLFPGWHARSPTPEQPVGAARAIAEWTDCLCSAGFDAVHSAQLGGEGATLDIVLGRAPARRADSSSAATSNVIQLTRAAPIRLAASSNADAGGLLAALAAALARHGRSTQRMRSLRADHRGVSSAAATASSIIETVVLVGTLGRDSADIICTRILEIRSLIEAVHDQTARLWLLLPGGARSIAGLPGGDPVSAALWAFARTARNENPDVDIRLVDWCADLSADGLATRLASLLIAPGRETEILLDTDAVRAVRVCRLEDTRGASAAGSPSDPPSRNGLIRLDLRSSESKSLQRPVWATAPRRPPGDGEVEIAVAATGLNYRDVMWLSGMLPDEALEDGHSGPTAGIECSGRVTAVGRGVDGFRIGDRVVALPASAFTTHAVVSADAVARLPDGIDEVAAATIPVALLTAYYALHHLARLAEGETVLVHGGAGGVGLAALQVARWRGARVIATAGSEEKRALLAQLGVEHVLDSRSLAFADGVLALTGGEGVDVVLNSLAGDAMERSLALTRPFGRFLELGKRDFYANTAVGLRPFRRNVSYFAIDADQLLARQPRLARQLLAELMELLGSGTLSPLPYRCFAAGEIGSAFRLMQQSGHIGKIVVTPPADAGSRPPQHPDQTFRAAADGHHLVIGGTGGLGIETAAWLAAAGARSIVLISRRGAPAAGADADYVADVRRQGVAVETRSCDVSDATALATLLGDLRRRGPIRGIVHAAMVLDDGLLANLDTARIAAVLQPKVAGVHHLDRLTRGDPLDYFVLYSSVAAMIGNPGQAAYVAANGFVEEVARQRRREQLPALALALGPVADTGHLLRDLRSAEALAMRAGPATLTARRALTALGRLLSRRQGGTERAVAVVAPISWAKAHTALASLASPTYALLQRLANRDGDGGSDRSDLAGRLVGLAETEAVALVVSELATEVARILRLPAEALDTARPLADLGMDSLMATELVMAARDRLGIEIPAVSMAHAVTLRDVAERAVRRLRSARVGSSSGRQDLPLHLIEQHITDRLDPDAGAAIIEQLSARPARARRTRD